MAFGFSLGTSTPQPKSTPAKKSVFGFSLTPQAPKKEEEIIPEKLTKGIDLSGVEPRKKAELQAIEDKATADYKAGKATLNQTRLTILNARTKAQQESQGIKQGVVANIPKAMTPANVKQQLLPEKPKPKASFSFAVGEGLSNKTQVPVGPTIAKSQAIARGDVPVEDVSLQRTMQNSTQAPLSQKSHASEALKSSMAQWEKENPTLGDRAKGAVKATGQIIYDSVEPFLRSGAIAKNIPAMTLELLQGKDPKEIADKYYALAGFNGKMPPKTFREALFPALVVASYGIGGGEAKIAGEAVETAIKGGVGQAAKEIGREALTVGAPVGGALGGAQAYSEGGNAQDVIKGALLGGASGAILQAGLSTVARGVGVALEKGALSKAQREAPEFIKVSGDPVKNTVDPDITYVPAESLGTHANGEPNSAYTIIDKNTGKATVYFDKNLKSNPSLLEDVLNAQHEKIVSSKGTVKGEAPEAKSVLQATLDDFAQKQGKSTEQIAQEIEAGNPKTVKGLLDHQLDPSVETVSTSKGSLLQDALQKPLQEHEIIKPEPQKYKTVDEFVNSKNKLAQLEKINKFNPMSDDYHTGIRSIEDIKTFKEAFDDPESFVYPDFDKEAARKALKDGKVAVYSSKPLDQDIAQFVTPSKMNANDYAGGGKVYSKTVNLDDVAWVNGDEGQLTGNTKSQLEEIYNKDHQEVAPTKAPPKKEAVIEKAKKTLEKVNLPTKKREEPTPNKGVSKVAKSVEAKSIEKSLTQGFSDLAEYNKITIKDQAERAAKLINTDIEEAKRIVRGEVPLPSELRGGTIIKAMEDYAIANNDARLLQDIASSPLTAETSIHAQELRTLAERNPESAVVALRDLKKARESQLEMKQQGRKISTIKKETVNSIKAELKKTTPKKQDWTSFIESIKCK